MNANKSKTEVENLIVKEADKKSICAADFCGIWTDEDFPSAEDMKRTLKELRSNNSIHEL